MPEDFKSRSMLRAIDRALEQRRLDRALAQARDYYETHKDFSPSELLLLSITFSATIRWGAGLDLEEKKIAHELWQQATHRMTRSIELEAASQGIRLAEIYLGRREANLAWNALLTVKPLIRFGELSLRYNRAVDVYVIHTGRSDTDLWID